MDNEKIINIFLKEIQNEMSIKISENSYTKIFLYIKNLLSEKENSKNLKAINFLSHTEEFIIVEYVIKKIFRKENIDLELPKEILLQITDLLIGNSLTNFEGDCFEIWIDEEKIVKDFIEKMSTILENDLTEDKVLFNTILYNIKPILYRIKNDIIISNSIYKDLILVNDSILEKVKIGLNEIENKLKVKFIEEEIALIGFHLKSAIKRNKPKNIKKVILICGLGYGSSKILEQSLKENYDLDIVDVMPYYLVGDLVPCCQNVDMILTTIELTNRYDVPVVKLNPILNEEDFVKLSKVGIRKSENRISLKEIISVIEKSAGIFEREKLIKDLKTQFKNKIIDDFFDAGSVLKEMLTVENVKVIEKVENWQEAIRHCGNILVENKKATTEYVDEMIGLVEKHGEYIVVDEGFAMPHGSVSEKVLETGISLLVVKEKVYFPTGKGANVFLSFASKNKTDYIEILNDLFELITKNDFINEMTKIESYSDVEEYFSKI